MPCFPPLFIELNYTPVTHVADVTQTANALLVRLALQRRRCVERRFDQPVRQSTISQSTVYRSPSAHIAGGGR